MDNFIYTFLYKEIRWQTGCGNQSAKIVSFKYFFPYLFCFFWKCLELYGNFWGMLLFPLGIPGYYFQILFSDIKTLFDSIFWLLCEWKSLLRHPGFIFDCDKNLGKVQNKIKTSSMGTSTPKNGSNPFYHPNCTKNSLFPRSTPGLKKDSCRSLSTPKPTKAIQEFILIIFTWKFVLIKLTKKIN